jgi:hypothetical protein
MLSIIEFDPNSLVIIRCNDLIESSNNGLGTALSNYRAMWLSFWNPTKSLSEMQAQLDKLAAIPGDATYPNALIKYFGIARASVVFLSAVIDSPFAASRVDQTGKFQEYLSPGWVCKLDASGQPVFETDGRLLVTGPCQWV